MRKMISLEERFVEKILITDDCWKWTASKYHDGYGIFRKGSKIHRAHRISYEIFIGEIPDDMLVCHHCDNPACVKPSHLFLGTIQDNIQDKCDKGRASGGSLKGEDSPSHKFTEDIVKNIRLLYATGKFSYSKLSKKFGVSKPTVKDMVKRRTWRHI